MVELRKEEKAKGLTVKLEKEVESGMIFKVSGSTHNHTVIFDKLKNDVSCDCKYSSLFPGKECSHVISVKLWLKNENLS